MADFPKAYMTVSELRKMGFPRSFTDKICHHGEKHGYACRNGEKGNFLIDTAELNKQFKKGVFAKI